MALTLPLLAEQHMLRDKVLQLLVKPHMRKVVTVLLVVLFLMHREIILKPHLRHRMLRERIQKLQR